MLDATDQERQSIVDYLASQAPDERVELLQKLYSEQLHGVLHNVWDVHTDKDRWWVITPPTNLYSQAQFPNMDLALTFHVGLCMRIPRDDRRSFRELPVEPLLGCWRVLDQAHASLGIAQEAEDYQAVGARCRECLLTLIHSVQDVVAVSPSPPVPKRSEFIGWAEVIAGTLLPRSSHKARRQLLRASSKSAWDFVSWLIHSRNAQLRDAEAAVAATEQVLSLFTTACIRHLRGVPDRCPACGSQRLAPERGFDTSAPEKVYERPVCSACSWAGQPVEIPIAAGPIAPPRKPEGDCTIMEVPLRGSRAPEPTSDGD